MNECVSFARELKEHKQQGFVKLFKSDRKYFYIVTNNIYLSVNTGKKVFHLFYTKISLFLNVIIIIIKNVAWGMISEGPL